MPTYEYVCSKCSHTFECVQSMSAPVLDTCPKGQCPKKTWGKGKVKRGIGGGAGLIFKGSGFYITDYRSEGYKNSAKKESGGSSGDAKPAATPATTPGASASASANASPSSGTSSGTSTVSKAATPPPAPKTSPTNKSAGSA